MIEKFLLITKDNILKFLIFLKNKKLKEKIQLEHDLEERKTSEKLKAKQRLVYNY
jgi:hypothetical protein